MKKAIVNFVDDALLVAGCLAVLVGLAMISIPLTWIVGGIMLIGFSVLVGKAKAKYVAQ
jgi:hypothetical protein